jgi:hypothetical protein
MMVPNLSFQLSNPGIKLPAQIVQEFAKWPHLGALMAFDIWIANTDRHPGNLLFGGNGDIWLIDHGHSFTGPTWLGNNLDPSANYANRLTQWLTPELDAPCKIRGVASANEYADGIISLDTALAGRCSQIAIVLSIGDAQAVTGFIHSRKLSVKAQANSALGFLC